MDHRLENSDLLLLWQTSFWLFFLLTWSLKWSFVASVFALVNIFMLFNYFALPQNDHAQLEKFLSGLKVGAHRGLAEDAPENTLGAIRQAKTLGADSVEFDLEFTSDGVPVLMHDDTVDRTTDGSGNIENMKWDDVKLLSAAAKFSPRDAFRNERVPTLEESLKLSLELGLKIFIDVKRCHPKLTEILLAMFQKYDALYNNAAVCSFFPQVIFEVKKADPRIIVGHTWRPGFFSYKDIAMTEPRYGIPLSWLAKVGDWLNIWLIHHGLFKLTGASLILTETKQISRNYVEEWKNRGVQVVAWTTNDLHEKIYFLHGLELPYLTDKLSDMQEMLTHRDAQDAWSIPGSEEGREANIPGKIESSDQREE